MNDNADALNKIHALEQALESAAEQLVAFARNSDSEVRARAIEAMETLRDPDVELRLEQALDDDDELVRVAALDAIALRAELPWRALVVGLLSDESELIRSHAATALAEVGSEDDMSTLEAVLRGADDEEQIAILYALYKLGRDDVLPVFLSGLTHEFDRVRSATANLCGGLIDDDNRSAITWALHAALAKEKTVAARSSIENALAEIGTSHSHEV